MSAREKIRATYRFWRSLTPGQRCRLVVLVLGCVVGVAIGTLAGAYLRVWLGHWS